MSGEGGFDDANYDRGMEELLKVDGDDGEGAITDWTEVHETFDSMNLAREPPPRDLRVRFREAVRDPAARYRALHQGPRRHPAGAVRYG